MAYRLATAIHACFMFVTILKVCGILRTVTITVVIVSVCLPTVDCLSGGEILCLPFLVVYFCRLSLIQCECEKMKEKIGHQNEREND